MTPRKLEKYGRLAVLLMIIAFQARTGAGSDRTTPGRTARGDVHYYAIVGGVHAPATYSSDQDSVLLRHLVERAGGLTDDASGGFRIVHRDRQTQVLIVKPDLPDASLRVPSGAVIVVESSRTVADALRHDDMIHVACRELLSRPVVLGGSVARMTLPQLLAALGQDRLDPESIEVLPRTVRLGRDTVIPTGTVLTFDPAALDREALTQVLQRSPLTDVRPLNEPPVERQPPLPVVENNPPGPLELPREATAAIAVSPDPAPEPEVGSRLMPAAAPAPSAPSISVVASGPLQQDPEPPVSPVVETQIASESAEVMIDELIHPVAASKEVPPRGTRKPHAAATAAVVAVSEGDPGTAPAVRARSGFGSRQVLYAAAAAAALAFLATVAAVVWSRRERRRLREIHGELSLAGSPAPTAPSERHVLDLLINDELPVVVEEVVFPEGTEFHGRAVGFRYLVQHDPQSLRGPHFATAAPSRERAAVAARRESERATGATATRHQPVSSSPVSPLERALRAQQRGTSR